MPLPEPESGLVISYSYLWLHEHQKGRQEGLKTRPCVIVLAVEEIHGDKIVTVAPITHTPPISPSAAVEIPPKVKRHLGLDHARSWVLLSEVNQFTWPGFDLRHVPASTSRYDFGFLPPKLFKKIKTGILNLFLERRMNLTKRG